MRKLIDHKVNGLNERIEIHATDEAGDGGANHNYIISFSKESPCGLTGSLEQIEITFQKGPIKIAGYNGISNEALMAIVLDRLRGFQSGQFRCRENALALTALEESLLWLNKRTQDRMKAGIEGTYEK